MNHSRLIVSFSILSLLLGCQTTHAPIKVPPKISNSSKKASPPAATAHAIEKPKQIVQEPVVPQEPATSNNQSPTLAPSPVVEAIAPEAPVISSSPAVLALMQEVDASRSRGDMANASVTLERAIRIQPRNPLLWQQLAEIRLAQHQPELAEDLAKKSNVLASGNKQTLRKNWQLIAEARRQKNDLEGAMEADFKAHE